MYDLLIRGGTVVDGTGAAPRTADIAVRDGTIVEVGKVSGAARETIDADGALVTPGFIDLHTHYDGQFLWDDTIDPSFSHGVTTAIAGNCGVGFAPYRPEFRKELIELMEGVEDIPGIVLDQGMAWNWSSFGDYLDRLGEREYTMDVASHITHAPLRVAVMGERALNHEAATPDDIAEMARHVRAAMDAGAVGFSGARLLEHTSTRGAIVPGSFAADDELLGIARAMGESGHGTFQIIPLGAIGGMVNPDIGREARRAEHQRLARIAEVSGRPVNFTLVQYQTDPEDWRMMLDETERAHDAGLRIHPQVASRPGGLLALLDAHHPFRFRPGYREVARLPLADRVKALRDPARRARILAEEDDFDGAAATDRSVTNVLRQSVGAFYAMTPPIDFEPGPEDRIDHLAARAGISEEACLYDHLTAGDGGNIASLLSLNYAGGGLDAMRTLLDHPHVVPGLGDGGAHLGFICDASMTTSHLTFWARDRTRGPLMAIERVVHNMTGKSAALYDLDDRGTIAPGKRADINVIDFAALTLDMPSIVRDLPNGGPRLLQKSRGYLATMVNGTVTRRDDADTGARPGRLYRSGRRSA